MYSMTVLDVEKFSAVLTLVLTLVIVSSKPVCGLVRSIRVDSDEMGDLRRTINVTDVHRILKIHENYSGADFQFLYSQEYEGVVGKLAGLLSTETCGLVTILNDGKPETLNQMFASCTTATSLVLLTTPTQVLQIFHMMRDEQMKSHTVSWIVIMEGEDWKHSVDVLETLVPEGTFVRIFLKDSRGSLNAFLSKIDENGVTRFKLHGSDLSDPGLLRNPYDKKRPHNYSLNGRQLTIAVKESIFAIAFKRRPSPDRSVEVKAEGEFTFIHSISKVLNFTYKTYISPDDTWGHFLPNGTVTGIIGMVVRRETTLASSILGITQQRERVVDFTAPLFGTRSMLFSRFPKVKSRALAVLSPFHLQVWMCLAAAVVFIGPVIYLVSYAMTTYQEADVKLDLQWYAFNMFRNIVIQGNYIETESWPTRFILFVWFVFCVIFYALYSGVLTAVLAVPSYETPIDSLNDLPRATKEGFTIGMLGGSSYESFFKTADEGLYKQTWDLLNHEDRSKSFVNNINEGMRRVLGERFVFIAGENYMRMIKRRYGERRFHFGQEMFFPVYVGIACQTGSPISHVLTHWILRIDDTGLVGKWLNDEFKRVPRDPSVTRDVEAKTFAITLTHLQAGFYVASLGLSLASMIMLLELVIFYCGERKLLPLK